MGRPLNKKYFGNRNVGRNGREGFVTNDYNPPSQPNETNTRFPDGDDGIGGEGIESYTLPVELGSIEVDSNSGQPTLTIPAPQLPGGVQATATVVWEVASITVTSGNDYGTGYVNGETVTFTGASGVTATIAVAADDIGVITPVNRGSFTTINPSETFQIVGAVGNDAQAEIRWRVKSITKLEKGSGYTTAPTLSWAAGPAGAISGTSPGAPTAVLTVDTGAVGSATNQENAIIAYVYQDDERRIADIVKQSSSRRYVFITNSDGAGSGKEDEAVKGKLVSHLADANGEADITAFDSDDNEYWVTKLTAHKALLTRKISGDGQFASGTSVKWTFGNAVASKSVKIENA